MPNGPPPPPPGEEGPYIWYDSYWDCDVWTSGNASCVTRVDSSNFDASMNSNLTSILSWVWNNAGVPMITGGNETACHGTGSRHYCGKAVDLDCNSWPPAVRDEFKTWISGHSGWCYIEEGGHFHVSASASGCS